MNKTIIFFNLVFWVNMVFAQQKDNRLTIGTIDSVQSNILGEKRKIWVYIPDQDANSIFSKQQYPVVYLLDGKAHFYSVVGMIDQLSRNLFCPKMIVVGILNTDRTRDLTPTHIDAEPPYYISIADSAFYKTSGGGENFIAFIEKELMPHIEAKHKTAPYKMLIGHSYGGLAVMQNFVHHNNLFNAYISIDPSLHWDNQKLMKQAQNILAEKRFDGKSLYMGIANTMDKDIDIKKVPKDTSDDTHIIRPILALHTSFEQNKQNGIKYKGKYYADETHSSVPLVTTYDALRFIFDYYPLKLSMIDYTDSTTDLAEKYQTHFYKISKQIGYAVKPEESEMNYMGYDFLEQKHFSKAKSFFEMNMDNYPESFNVYSSMGDFYIAIDDKAKAIEFYIKALTIKEYPATRNKLDKLKTSKTE